MSIYFIGDIQGCYSELKAILKQVKFDPEHDQLWVAGDMVARGPDSYKTLKYLMSLGKSVKAVLGNHDLHLLAIHAGLRKAKVSDHLDDLLSAKDLEKLINWLTKQPLLRKFPDENVYMSHAGISPQWTISQAKKMAKLATEKLTSAHKTQWLSKMYGEAPNDWSLAHTPEEQFRFTINAFTRMRYCDPQGRLDFSCKTSPENTQEKLVPWYTLNKKLFKKNHWVFGHWAALMGKTKQNQLYALDTGCVWGGHLTLLRWHDKKFFIEQAHKK